MDDPLGMIRESHLARFLFYWEMTVPMLLSIVKSLESSIGYDHLVSWIDGEWTSHLSSEDLRMGLSGVRERAKTRKTTIAGDDHNEKKHRK
jgi:hypothetical protein